MGHFCLVDFFGLVLGPLQVDMMMAHLLLLLVADALVGSFGVTTTDGFTARNTAWPIPCSDSVNLSNSSVASTSTPLAGIVLLFSLL